MAIFIVVVICLTIILWAMLRTPGVQTFLTKKITSVIAEKTNLKIEIGKARLRLNSNILLNNIIIYDTLGKKMLVLNSLEAGINKIDLNKKTVKLSLVSLSQPNINIYQTGSNRYNFSFISDIVKNNNNNTNFDWNIHASRLKINNLECIYTDTNKNIRYLSNLNFIADSINIEYQSVKFNISGFATHYNKVPFIDNLTASVNIINKQLIVNNIKLVTQNSYGNIQVIEMRMPKNGGIEYLYSKINSLRVSPADIAIFDKRFSNITDEVKISGSVIISGKNVKADNLLIYAGQKSILSASANFLNIGNQTKFSYSLNIDNLVTNNNEISSLLSQYMPNTKINLPPQLNNLGDISFSGFLFAVPNSITSQGELTVNQGNIIADVTINRLNKNNYIIDGKITADPLDLGIILNNSALKQTTFSVTTKGSYNKQKGINININSIVRSMAFNAYSLDSISVNGNLTRQKFTGRISSFDPNARFDFEGQFNLGNTATTSLYDFYTNVYYLNLHALGLAKNDTNANLSVNVVANFVGNSVDNSNGKIYVTDLYYFQDTTYLATDSLTISSVSDSLQNEILFSSEYLDAQLKGKINIVSLIPELKNIVKNYIPSLNNNNNITTNKNNFTYIIKANYPHPVTERLLPNVKISPGTTVYGELNSINKIFNINLNSGLIEINNHKITGLQVKTFTKNNIYNINLSSNEFFITQNNSLKNFLLSIKINNDSITSNINWNNWLQNNSSGNINFLASINKNFSLKQPLFKIDIYPSNVITLDTLWNIAQSSVTKNNNGFVFDNIKINNGYSNLLINGAISNNNTDSLTVNVKNINLNNLNTILKQIPLRFDGNITGMLVLKDFTGEKQLKSNLLITGLKLKNKPVGDAYIKSGWDNKKQHITIDLELKNNNKTTTKGVGYISPKNREINIQGTFDKQPAKIVEGFLEPNLTGFTGTASGSVLVSGDLRAPFWNGYLVTDSTQILIKPTNVKYMVSDTVLFNNSSLVFKNLVINDMENNKATLNGSIDHYRYLTWKLGLQINTNKIIGLNTTAKDNQYYYAKAYGSGFVSINGPSENVAIKIMATTLNNTVFYLPLESSQELHDNDFIVFTQPFSQTDKNNLPNKKNIKQNINKPIQESKLTLNLDLTVTPEAEVNIIFDPRIGDVLKANGRANLNMEVNDNDFLIYGDYSIYHGEFTFTLQNVINKKLEIQQNSSIKWSGDPLDADIDIDAIYKIRRASVFDLTLNDSDKEKKVDVNCHLLMTNKLINPNIAFAVDVPTTTNAEAIDQLNSLHEQDLNKQILSLLLVNKFSPLPGLVQNSTTTTTNLGSTTASEILSNQLSQLISQVSSDFDLGVTYRPGDNEYTQQQYEVAFSTKLWDERILVNGNVGYDATNTTNPNASTVPTDLEVEVKLNKKGNIRFKAFSKVNRDLIYSEGPYTQGIGLFYTEDFNTIKELWKRIFGNKNAIKPDETIIIDENPGTNK